MKKPQDCRSSKTCQKKKKKKKKSIKNMQNEFKQKKKEQENKPYPAMVIEIDDTWKDHQ